MANSTFLYGGSKNKRSFDAEMTTLLFKFGLVNVGQ